MELPVQRDHPARVGSTVSVKGLFRLGNVVPLGMQKRQRPPGNPKALFLSEQSPLLWEELRAAEQRRGGA